ncbi:hypothetical protein U0070_018247 [Myodes glareolus]|uniref:Anaphylatoxin-like domain-containing protein n=1 Tax=Myodes glareolus TaxID=447135 RepID=A0AAW0HLS1_MYOGA
MEQGLERNNIEWIQDTQLSEGQSSFSYVYLEVVSKHFSKSEERPILYDNGSLFVHTDKPVYTPQQHVQHPGSSGKDLVSEDSSPDNRAISSIDRIPYLHDKVYNISFIPISDRQHELKFQDLAQGVILQSTDYLEQKIREQGLASYVIAAPKVIHVGASENVVIQAHGYTEAFDLGRHEQCNDEDEECARLSYRIGFYPSWEIAKCCSWARASLGFVTVLNDSCSPCSEMNPIVISALQMIQDKHLSEGQSSFSYVYLEVVSKHFSKSEKRPILYDNGSLFVHTDKPVYTPQQHDTGDGRSRLNIEKTLPPTEQHTLTSKNTYLVRESFDGREFSLEILDSKDTCINIVSASTYNHPVVKKCCYDGARPSAYETCEQRAERVKKTGPRCVQAFIHCCTIATQIRAKDTFKYFILAIPPGSAVAKLRLEPLQRAQAAAEEGLMTSRAGSKQLSGGERGFYNQRGMPDVGVQEGEYPNRLDPKNPVYAEETSPSVIVNGFSERLRASHIQRIRPHSENLVGSRARSVAVQLPLILHLAMDGDTDGDPHWSTGLSPPRSK